MRAFTPAALKTWLRHFIGKDDLYCGAEVHNGFEIEGRTAHYTLLRNEDYLLHLRGAWLVSRIALCVGQKRPAAAAQKHCAAAPNGKIKRAAKAGLAARAEKWRAALWRGRVWSAQNER